MSKNATKPFVSSFLKASFVNKNVDFLNPARPADFSRKNVSYNRVPRGRRRPNFAWGKVSYYGGQTNEVYGSRENSGDGKQLPVGTMNVAQVKDVNVGLKNYQRAFTTLQKGYVKSEKLIGIGEAKISKFSAKYSPKVAKHVGAFISAVFNPGSVSAKEFAKLKKKSEKVSSNYSSKIEKISTNFGGKETDVRERAYVSAASTSDFTKHTSSRTFLDPIHASYKRFDVGSSNKRSTNKDFSNLNLKSDIASNLYSSRNISFGRVKKIVNDGYNTLSSFRNRRNTDWGRKNPDKMNVTFTKP